MRQYDTAQGKVSSLMSERDHDGKVQTVIWDAESPKVPIPKDMNDSQRVVLPAADEGKDHNEDE